SLTSAGRSRDRAGHAGKSSSVCDLFSGVTKPYVSKTGVDGRPHLGVLARSLGVLSRVIFQKSSQLSGLTRQLILWDVFTTGGAFRGYNGLCLLPAYFGGSVDMEYAKKLVVEAFEEDTGLKVGSGVGENDGIKNT
ncbi:hypothetical protein THAOC_28834, partial [Thalassiosira oceanica]